MAKNATVPTRAAVRVVASGAFRRPPRPASRAQHERGSEAGVQIRASAENIAAREMVSGGDDLPARGWALRLWNLPSPPFRRANRHADSDLVSFRMTSTSHSAVH
jgi:hypothetical protein